MAGRRAKIQSTATPAPAANPSGTLLRGLDVLQAFRPERPLLGNTDISAATGLPKATVSRLTRALVDAGYLEYESARGKYQLCPRVLTLGFSLLSNMTILPIAHEQLQKLATSSGCTVSLAWPDAPNMIYLDRCSGEAMPYFFSVGSAIDMARTATGRSYIAALDPASRESLIKTLAAHRADDWSSVEKAIRQAIVEVADRGFCLVDTTWRKNIRSVAAPVLSRDGRPKMSINCVTTTFSMQPETLVKKWGPRLVKVAHILSDHL
jgi:DNA-binding IclR family transcriptional regulator